MPGLGVDLDGIPLVACREHGGGVVAFPVGEPVSWEVWVSNAYLNISTGGMTFTATVLTRVGDHWSEETRTVDASVLFDLVTNKLRLVIDDFKVNLSMPNVTLRLVDADPPDLSKIYALAMEVPPHAFSVPLPGAGGTRNVNARIVNATPSFAPGVLTVNFDVEF
jgi:hypothetical protein